MQASMRVENGHGIKEKQMSILVSFSWHCRQQELTLRLRWSPSIKYSERGLACLCMASNTLIKGRPWAWATCCAAATYSLTAASLRSGQRAVLTGGGDNTTRHWQKLWVTRSLLVPERLCPGMHARTSVNGSKCATIRSMLAWYSVTATKCPGSFAAAM